MKRIIGAAVGAGVLVAWQVGAAWACGGFFCDGPSPGGPLPIAQAAENVLFVMGHDPASGASTVEAHIQVLYTGPASKFSWIVPVTSVPTVSVGADILFDRIEPPTRPSFNVTYQQEGNCRGVSGVGAGCGSAAGGVSASANGDGTKGDHGQPEVDVLSHGSVGPYDYVVIKSEDGGTLRSWLTDHGYYVSEDAARIIDEYVAGQFSFVAVRLQGGQDVSAIRPIVLRMTAPEACLPLKLTAIASTPDLRINVWVLGDARAVPINYAEIAINQARLDWFNFGRNYDALLKDAANEAKGNAFAVEYAMSARSSTTWFALATNARSRLASANTPADFVSALSVLGLQPTGAVLQVLRKQIPIPASIAAMGISESNFYGSINYFWNTYMADFAAFDAAAAATAMDTEVLTPMATYARLFDRDGKLTRLATFISPEEMTTDPLFVTNPGLPDVAPQHIAVAHVLCGDGLDVCVAPVRLRTENGSDVMYRATGCLDL